MPVSPDDPAGPQAVYSHDCRVGSQRKISSPSALRILTASAPPFFIALHSIMAFVLADFGLIDSCVAYLTTDAPDKTSIVNRME